jgi:hypothetical protein
LTEWPADPRGPPRGVAGDRERGSAGESATAEGAPDPPGLRQGDPVLLIGTKCRCSLGVQHAIDRTSVDPFDLQALLPQPDVILDEALPLVWVLRTRCLRLQCPRQPRRLRPKCPRQPRRLRCPKRPRRLRPKCPRQPRPRRPRRPGLPHDGTHPQDADDQHGHQHVHRVSSSVLTRLVSFRGVSAYD